MKPALLFLLFAFLAGCARDPGEETTQSAAPTKADIKAREDFARTLPKPPEH